MEKELKVPVPMPRQIYLSGPINEQSAEMCIKKFEEIRSSDATLKVLYNTLFKGEYNPEPIELIINSFGGSVYDMFAIIASMEASGQTPVSTFCFGTAMSAAFVIFIKGYQRYATRLTTFMIHPLTGIEIGSPDQLKIVADEAQRVQKLMNQMIIGNTNITSKLLKQKFSLGDWFITPQEATKLKIADAWLKSDRREVKKLLQNNQQKQ